MTTKHRPLTPTRRKTEHVGLLTYLRARAADVRTVNPELAHRYDRWERAVWRLLNDRSRRDAYRGGE
jgi:hypothetical protein